MSSIHVLIKIELLSLHLLSSFSYLLLTLYPRRVSRDMLDPTFYQNDLAMRNTAVVTGGNPIAVSSL
jgi:hypothetical protein